MSREMSTAELRLPADSAYVAAVRLTTAALAARLGFTIEEIEDARIAVTEACTLLLENRPPADGDHLEVHYELDPSSLGVHIRVPGEAGIDRDSFGWQLLTAVTSDLTVESVDGLRYLRYASKPATRSE